MLSFLARRARRATAAAAPWLCMTFVMSAAPEPEPSPTPTPTPRFSEAVVVARVLVDVRALDPRGAPLLGLEPRHFEVEIDGRRVEVESAQWVPQGPGSQDDAPQVSAPETLAEAEARLQRDDVSARGGRLLVLLFQKDLHPSRAPGLLAMRRRAAELVRELHPEDRVALLSYDTHLRFWLDFTGDRARLGRALERFLVQGRPPLIDPGEPPSLAERYDRPRARRAASLESALLVLGEALEPIEGAKSLVLFGWGLGRLSGGQVVFEDDYAEALLALSRARTTVFALDVTDADHHTLEVGLKSVAAATGGFYARTKDFPALALQRVEGAAGGHYVLALPAPAGRGTHALRVRLVGRKGTILARPFIEG